jgi:hypothetical protein
MNQRLVDLAQLDDTTVTSTNELDAWIDGLAPGLIIKKSVCDIVPLDCPTVADAVWPPSRH